MRKYQEYCKIELSNNRKEWEKELENKKKNDIFFRKKQIPSNQTNDQT